MSRLFGEDAAVLGGAPVTPAELAALESDMADGLGLPAPPGGLVDVHCHLGRDADGHRLAAGDLVADLDRHGVRSAVCFPADEPGADGTFGEANAAVLAAAREHPGRIVPFCRVDPRREAAATMECAGDGGARGLKLHPVAQRFALDDAEVIAAVADAAARGWPTLIHAGFAARPVAGALGRLLDAVPGARLILAHGGRGDVRALLATVVDRPGVHLDTSLAALPDLVALGPERLLFGSDRPYGEHATALLLVARAAELGGWSEEALRGVMGDNARAVLAR